MSRYLKILILTGVLLLLAGPVFVPKTSIRAAPAGYDPNVLSYGMYWFGLNNARQKFEPGQPNPYFDPSRPTVIFVHGWQPGISATEPPNFDYTYLDGLTLKTVHTADAWVNAGWNIGIFYWNQFSDEANVTDAEAKIWVNDGPKNMRWRKGDGTYADAPLGTPSAGELFYQTYLAAMTENDYTGGEIRIAGHSLGSQMAVRLTQLLREGIAAGEAPAKLLPTRVVLLDPYWSIGAKTWLDNRTTGETVRDYVTGLLRQGILFEWYRSSNLTVEPNGYSNDPLQPMMLYAEMHPNFVADDMSKHIAARHLYFWAYAFNGPASCTGTLCINIDRLLAKMTNDQLAALMRSDYTWSQTSGQTTATPDDDTYQSSLRADAPYTVTQLTASPAAPVAGFPAILTATVQNKTSSPAGDGVLVTFNTSLGTIFARSVTGGGVATASLASAMTGTARITATTTGAGGTAQRVAVITFGPAQYLYLPVIWKN